MEKRGSQVGFVLSFVIFVIFVFFLFVLIKPSLKTSNSSNLPQNVVIKLADVASANITSISISFPTTSQDCFEMENFFTNSGAGTHLKAIDDNGSEASLTISSGGSNLYVTKNASQNFVRIYSSDEFPETANGSISGCPLISENSTGYSIGLIKTEKKIFVSKIISLLTNYSQNYDGLKDTLGVPSADDFGFSFLYSNGTVLSTPSKSLGNVNIYAYETPVQYVMPSGNIEEGFINVRTW